MVMTLSFFRLCASVRTLAALSVLVALCGCASMRFKVKRETRFINMDAEVLHVAYGEEKRSKTLSSGIVCTFDGKVRLQFPDGKRIVLYQALSSSGMRYVSKDMQFEFREKGPYCILSQYGKTIFEGVYCRK